MNNLETTEGKPVSNLGFSQVSVAGYFCRVGRHGEIGRFVDRERVQPSRGRSVVLRTKRGLEIGKVLRPITLKHLSKGSSINSANIDFDGTLLRVCTAEDQLLREKLEEAAHTAFISCQDYLTQNLLGDRLLDVEALLDAKTLYFYFVGLPSEEIAPQLDKLVEIFQTTVRESQFAKLLDEGCGPGCGTEEKGGCGTSGSCAVCVIAKACKK
jgi:cell fate regulator YaaT (PSP1 superfamily)